MFYGLLNFGFVTYDFWVLTFGCLIWVLCGVLDLLFELSGVFSCLCDCNRGCFWLLVWLLFILVLVGFSLLLPWGVVFFGVLLGCALAL